MCFRLASPQQMQWQAWSWWRLEFLRSSWRCLRCPWCLFRSFFLWSSVNTQRGPDPWMCSTKPFRLGCNTHTGIQTHAHTRWIDWQLTVLPCGCRLIIGLEYALLVWWTPSVKQDGGFPVYYYGIVLLSYAVHQVWNFCYSLNYPCFSEHMYSRRHLGNTDGAKLPKIKII